MSNPDELVTQAEDDASEDRALAHFAIERRAAIEAGDDALLDEDEFFAAAEAHFAARASDEGWTRVEGVEAVQAYLDSLKTRVIVSAPQADAEAPAPSTSDGV